MSNIEPLKGCISESITSKDWLEATKDMTISAYSPFLNPQETGAFTKADFERDLSKVSQRVGEKQPSQEKTQT